MNETIHKRKSIRKYDMTELDAAALEKVRENISDVIPLYTDIQYSIEIVSKTKGIFGIKAPHYLIFCSEERYGAYENIGFVGQQLNLFFAESGLGACWLGMAKPEEQAAGALPFVISMAFGKPDEPLYRDLADFKRRPLSEISEGADERLEAARLSPSGMNTQGWYFVADSGKIHCYCKKPGALLGFMAGKLGCIDMGIALCHIAVESDEFRFIKEPDAPVRKGYIYMGAVIK